MDAWFVGFTLRKNLDIPSPFCWTAAHDSDDAAQVFAKVTDALSFFLAQE